MVLSDQEEIKPQAPPPRPDLVPAYPTEPLPREDLVPEETLIERADRAAYQALMGPTEAIANIGTGVAGWMGGQVVGYGKLLYDTWRTGGKGASWQEFENDFQNASKAISTVGGIYQPQTQMGKEIARMAGMSFEKANHYWGGVVDKFINDPERNAALKTVGGTAIGLILGKAIHGVGKSAVGKVRNIVTDVPASKIAFPTKDVMQRIGPAKEMATAIRQMKPLLKEQQAARSRQYAQKFAKSKAVSSKVGGEAGAIASIKSMAGEMAKVEFNYESIRQSFTQEKIDSLFNEITKTPLLTEGQRLTARKALLDMFSKEGSSLPQNQQLVYLARVFGKDFVSAVRSNWDTWSKVKHHIFETVNIPRSLMASFDASAPFRQGLMMIGRKEFWGAFKEMYSILRGKKSHEAIIEDIYQRDTYPYMERSGLELTETASEASSSLGMRGNMADTGIRTGMREESFQSHYAEKIPFGIGKGVEISGEMYAGFLNKVRADVFDSLFKDAERLGLDPKGNPKLSHDIASYINSGTGRGRWGQMGEQTGAFINSFFFSPRLIKARLDFMNLGWYMKLEPYARKQALKSLLTVASAGMTTLGVAKFAGADVGTDPKSASFGKIKIGNTYIDIWGGHQQYIVPLARIFSGKYTSSTTGKTTKLGEGFKGTTPYDVLLRSIEYKESPIASFATALLKGKDAKGQDIKIGKEALERVVPMVIQDFIDIAKDDPTLLPTGFLGIFGVGLQTYEPKKGIVR